MKATFLLTAKSKTLLKILGLTFGVVLLLEILFDPLSFVGNIVKANQVRGDLPTARARWEARGITDYTIEVEGFVPLTCVYAASLTVKQGVLVNVLARSMPFDETAPWISVSQEKWDDPQCSYTNLLIPEIFKRVEQDLKEIDPWDAELKVAFDPEYGFITHYELNYGYGHGLLSPAISECCTRYEFRNFQPIGAQENSAGEQEGGVP